jgi:hypothetical protein
MTIASNYAGNAAVPFVAPAVLSADTIANGFCTVLDNVRYKTNLRKLDNGTVQARACAFTSPATPLDISDVQLTLTELAVNEEICNHELARTWAAEQMRGGFAPVPGDYERFLAEYVASKVAESIERNIWQGKYASDDGGTDGTYTLFDSIMSRVVAASPTHDTNAPRILLVEVFPLLIIDDVIRDGYRRNVVPGFSGYRKRSALNQANHHRVVGVEVSRRVLTVYIVRILSRFR